MARELWWHVEHTPAALEAATRVWQQLTGKEESLEASALGAGQACSLELGAGADSWTLKLIDDDTLALWQEHCKAKAKGRVASEDTDGSLALEVPLVLFDASGAALALPTMGKMKPLHLDFENAGYRQRLLRGGRIKEPVARAVMQGLKPRAERLLVFDATAGLGRESMILAHAGSQVYAFERQLPIWCILCDALQRAQRSRFFPFPLPQLQKLGTIRDYAAAGATAIAGGAESVAGALAALPDVIYYDPMFPERESSAQVKKEMVLFQQLIGSDSDTLEFLEVAVALAVQRVVVKRPHDAPPLVIPERNIERSHFIDGGMCRFDCYTGRGHAAS